jgi:hypothetical protein
MSEDKKIAEDRAAAEAVMYKEAFVPAFFDRLAEHGVQPRNAADADEMLAMIDKLAGLNAMDSRIHTQTVEAQKDPFLKLASAALDEHARRVTPSKSLLEAAITIAAA